MQEALANLITQGFSHAGLARAATGVVAVAISLVIVNVFSMLLGELIPKNWAISNPIGVATVVTPFQRGFTRVFYPLILSLNATANAILRRFGVEPKEE